MVGAGYLAALVYLVVAIRYYTSLRLPDVTGETGIAAATFPLPSEMMNALPIVAVVGFFLILTGRIVMRFGRRTRHETLRRNLAGFDEELRRLKTLREQGAISEEEFTARRDRIIDSL